MTPFRQTPLVSMARALVAALAIGATLVSLAPGEAQAVRGRSTEAGDPDASGAGRPIPTAKEKPTKDDGVRCTDTQPDGHIDFYLPGDVIRDKKDGRLRVCMEHGGWNIVRNGGASMGTTTGGGGVYAP